MGHTLFLHPLLAVYADLPVLLYSLIAADVDILIWEELNHLLKHSLKELECALITHAKIP